MIDYNDDEVKYRKKRRSNVSASTKKSKHKHEYVHAMLHNKEPHPLTGVPHYQWRWCEYCKLCGKVSDYSYGDVEPNPHGPGLRQLTNDEFREKYKHLPVIETAYDELISVKYIPVEVNNG